MNQNVEATLPNFNRFKESLKVFLASTRQIAQKNKVPAWFNEFSNHLETFSDELSATVMNFEKIDCSLESQLSVQKAVTDGLVNERKKLEEKISVLKAEVEDLRQYSRRTNLLIHGVEETAQENTDNIIIDVINNKLGLKDITLKDVGRTHRLGRKIDGKKRPIIARFTSYRNRKMVFDAKRKLKNTGTVVTEHLTNERYALYNQCVDRFSRENVWSLDGRIYCLTGVTLPNGQKERLVVTREEDLK